MTILNYASVFGQIGKHSRDNAAVPDDMLSEVMASSFQLMAETRKAFPGVWVSRETLPNRSDPDELARIESEVRVLTSRLIDFGLHPMLAMEAAVQQIVLKPDMSLSVGEWCSKSRVHRQYASERNRPLEAARAGASLAIADWLDERAK